MRKSFFVSFFSLLFSSVFAFGQNTINVVSATGKPGEDVQVAITLTTDKNVAGAQFDLMFDKGKLQIKTAANGTDAAAMTSVGLDVAGANTSGKLSVSLVDFSFSNPIKAGSGKQLYLVTFTIASSASGEIPLTLGGVSLSDDAAADIAVTINNGAVTAGTTPPPPPPPTGGGENKISVTSVTGKAGEDVVVKVLATVDKKIAGAQFNINFDKSKLQIKTVANGADNAAMTNVGLDVAGANSSGKLAISLVDFSFSNPVAAGENKELLVVTFTIASSASAGDVALTVDGVSLSDDLAADIPATASNGAVTVTGAVEPPPAPDSDNDGLPDATDPCPNDPTNKCNETPPPVIVGNKFWVTDATIEAGKDVTVQVLVTSDKNVAGLQFALSFDKTKLQVKSVANGADAAAMTNVGLDVAGANTSGKLAISLVDFSFSKPIVAGGNKEVLTITFTVTAGASGELPLTLDAVSLSDDAAMDIAVTSANGKVTVTGGEEPPPVGEYAPGDVDRNGKVDIFDLLELLKILAAMQ